MMSVGTVLRNERESQGLALHAIAEELCIMPGYLQAIEADDLAGLPGVFFYKSFVRQYAAALGVDPALLKNEIQSATEPSEPLEQPAKQSSLSLGLPVGHSDTAHPAKPIWVPDPIAEAANRLDVSNRALGWPVAALVVALLGGAAFYSWWKQPAAVPAPIQTAQTKVESQPVLEPVSNGDPAPGLAAPPAINVTTSTADDGIRQVELKISAKETTWLSVTSGGKQIFSGMLFADQTKTLTAVDNARLKVGNAGGLDVQLNGKLVGPLGEHGQVRDVLLTPEGFSIVKQSVKAPDNETL
ncbi:MAG: RodZ domain-containing protein [Acidobacteriota bacterium]